MLGDDVEKLFGPLALEDEVCAAPSVAASSADAKIAAALVITSLREITAALKLEADSAGGNPVLPVAFRGCSCTELLEWKSLILAGH